MGASLAKKTCSEGEIIAIHGYDFWIMKTYYISILFQQDLQDMTTQFSNESLKELIFWESESVDAYLV